MGSFEVFNNRRENSSVFSHCKFFSIFNDMPERHEASSTWLIHSIYRSCMISECVTAIHLTDFHRLGLGHAIFYFC